MGRRKRKRSRRSISRAKLERRLAEYMLECEFLRAHPEALVYFRDDIYVILLPDDIDYERLRSCLDEAGVDAHANTELLRQQLADAYAVGKSQPSGARWNIIAALATLLATAIAILQLCLERFAPILLMTWLWRMAVMRGRGRARRTLVTWTERAWHGSVRSAHLSCPGYGTAAGRDERILALAQRSTIGLT
jgi:hypothetical protein